MAELPADAPAGAARELSRLDGNRIWRVETPQGPVLQKLYAERGSALHAWGREVATRLRGGKTSTRAVGRRATERRLLALWRAHGCDVPAELSDRHPDLAGERTLVLELIDGPTLAQVLADPGLPAERRRALIARFAADVARRHGLALQHGEAALVHEHGGTPHVLVAGTPGAPVEALRLVSFDLENAFTPRGDLRPLIAREVSSCVRSLARGRASREPGGDARLRDDLRAFVDGYGDRKHLAAAVDHYLRSPSPVWRAIWSLDRRGEERRGRPHGKYEVLEELDRILREG